MGDKTISFTEDELTKFKKELEHHWKDVGIEIGKQHQAPSETTKKLFEKNEEEHQKINLALFGDKSTDEIGINQMVKEMYVVFTSSGFTGKIIIKVFATIGIITGAIIGMIELVKRLK